MNFSEDYFKPEVRDGFYVSSRMKRTWAATLEVFEAVKKLCEDNNITYYADWGTLLGAVRHGGFIPWDDDFDIGMKREDYMRFIEVGTKDLPDGFALLNVHTEHEYDNLLTRVVNRKDITISADLMERYHGFPYNVGIDVFPLDYVCQDEEKEKARREVVRAIKSYIDKYDAEEIFLHDDITKSEISSLSEFLHNPIIEGRFIRKQLYQLMEIVFSIYDSEEGDMLASLAQEMGGLNKPIPKEYYDDIIQLPFENTYIAAPLLYDAILEIKYSNYMKVVKDCSAHGYPVFLGLENEIKSYGRITPWKEYSYDQAKRSISDKEDFVHAREENNDVLFLPYKASSWKYMEPLWSSMQQNVNITTYVMPIPYYDKDTLGGLGEFHYEGNLFPSYLNIFAFDQYDIEARHPAKIIIQNPYDEFDTAVTVPPFFYSERIKHFTDSLICIPEFYIDDFSVDDNRAKYNLKFYCASPGMINSDIVYVQSDTIRQRFIEILTDFMTESTRVHWESKIRVLPWEIVGEDIMGINEDEIPENWWCKLLDSTGTGKKVILYYNSASCLAQYREKYLKKMREVFEVFAKRTEEITVMFCTDINSKFIQSEKYNELYVEYNQIRDEYANLPYVILNESEDWRKAVAISDAYYGDAGHILQSFLRTKRPAMLQRIIN